MKGTVLVVDDEPEIRALCRVVLELEGFDVVEAGDGEEALRAAREHRPDLVLLDLMLPDRDGWEVLEGLHGDDATAAIPVVVMTARTGVEDQLHGWTAGVLDYVTKPFDPLALVALAEQAVAGRDTQREDERRRRVVEALEARRSQRS